MLRCILFDDAYVSLFAVLILGNSHKSQKDMGEYFGGF
jgi:hypothetical protein